MYKITFLRKKFYVVKARIIPVNSHPFGNDERSNRNIPM